MLSICPLKSLVKLITRWVIWLYWGQRVWILSRDSLSSRLIKLFAQQFSLTNQYFSTVPRVQNTRWLPSDSNKGSLFSSRRRSWLNISISSCWPKRVWIPMILSHETFAIICSGNPRSLLRTMIRILFRLVSIEILLIGISLDLWELRWFICHLRLLILRFNNFYRLVSKSISMRKVWTIELSTLD